MFRKRYTKWAPLGNYSHGGDDYIVFFKLNTKTGMMKFKVKTVHPWTVNTNLILPTAMIDTQKAWDDLTTT